MLKIILKLNRRDRSDHKLHACKELDLYVGVVAQGAAALCHCIFQVCG